MVAPYPVYEKEYDDPIAAAEYDQIIAAVKASRSILDAYGIKETAKSNSLCLVLSPFSYNPSRRNGIDRIVQRTIELHLSPHWH